MGYSERNNHIHITFITVYYHCPILLLAIIVNLQLCRIYKLNFIIYIGKNIVSTGFNTIHGFRHLLGVWNVSSSIRADY